MLLAYQMTRLVVKLNMEAVNFAWINLVVFVILVVSWTKDCGPPPHIEQSRNNATSDPTFPEATVVRYYCDFATTPYSWPLYTCTNGTWTNGWEDEFRCPWKTCSAPRIAHGSYKVESYTVGNIAEFQCDEGYKLKGSSRALCRIDRKWRTLPSCVVVRCPRPNGISNMGRFQNTKGREPNIYGNEIYNTCEDGYNLIGPEKQKCENNGQWTGPVPKCEKIHCGEPDVGTGGIAYYDNTHLYCMAQIECDPDAIFKGEEFIMCYEDGWSYGFCYGACDIPYIENGFRDTPRISHNVSLNWVCNRGFFKSSHEEILCNDGTLTEIPTCKPVEFGSDASCPELLHPDYSVTRYRDKCYIFINIHATCNEAKTKCHGLGWSIVTIDDGQEAQFINTALGELWTERTWLGIEWKNNRWVNWDGTELSYQNWYRGEGGSTWFGKYEKCAVLEQRGTNRRWNDLECDYRARVACVTDPRD